MWRPSSGQAAELLTFAALAGSGDHLVASAQLYGGTRTLLDVSLRRLGIDTTFVASDDPAAYAAEVRPNTKAIYTEVIGNPSGSIADLAALADVAHAVDLPLVVDSTLATPYLCRPMEHGADIVLHSATKFIGGHGTSIGGIVLESGRFPWDSGRFPQMTEPVASYNGCASGRTSPSTGSACASASSSCATSARASRRSTRSSSSSASRPWRCGWSSTSRTRRRSRSSSQATSGCRG